MLLESEKNISLFDEVYLKNISANDNFNIKSVYDRLKFLFPGSIFMIGLRSEIYLLECTYVCRMMFLLFALKLWRKLYSPLMLLLLNKVYIIDKHHAPTPTHIHPPTHIHSPTHLHSPAYTRPRPPTSTPMPKYPSLYTQASFS